MEKGNAPNRKGSTSSMASSSKPCENCEVKSAIVFCQNCEAHLCEECKESSHQAKILQRHKFTILGGSSGGETTGNSGGETKVSPSTATHLPHGQPPPPKRTIAGNASSPSSPAVPKAAAPSLSVNIPINSVASHGGDSPPCPKKPPPLSPRQLSNHPHSGATSLSASTGAQNSGQISPRSQSSAQPTPIPAAAAAADDPPPPKRMPPVAGNGSDDLPPPRKMPPPSPMINRATSTSDASKQRMEKPKSDEGESSPSPLAARKQSEPTAATKTPSGGVPAIASPKITYNIKPAGRRSIKLNSNVVDDDDTPPAAAVPIPAGKEHSNSGAGNSAAPALTAPPSGELKVATPPLTPDKSRSIAANKSSPSLTTPNSPGLPGDRKSKNITLAQQLKPLPQSPTISRTGSAEASTAPAKSPTPTPSANTTTPTNPSTSVAVKPTPNAASKPVLANPATKSVSATTPASPSPVLNSSTKPPTTNAPAPQNAVNASPSVPPKSTSWKAIASPTVVRPPAPCLSRQSQVNPQQSAPTNPPPVPSRVRVRGASVCYAAPPVIEDELDEEDSSSDEEDAKEQKEGDALTSPVLSSERDKPKSPRDNRDHTTTKESSETGVTKAEPKVVKPVAPPTPAKTFSKPPTASAESSSHLLQTTASANHAGSSSSGVSSFIRRLKKKYPSICAVLDDYSIGEEIGSGLFSVVYSVHRVSDNSPFAMKILNPEMSNGTREHEIMQQLKGKVGLIQLEKYIPHENGDMFILPLMSENNFVRLIGNEKHLSKPWSEKDIRAIFSSVLKSVKCLHENNIMHGDIVPENVLFHRLSGTSDRDYDEIVLAGFSNAMHADASKSSDGSGEAQNNGISYGDIEFQAPELLNTSVGQTEDVSIASDIWSLGCLLYYMAAGNSPFNDDNVVKMQMKIREGEIEWKEPSWASASADLKRLVSRLLVVNPGDRPTVDDILEDPWLTQEGGDTQLSCVRESLNQQLKLAEEIKRENELNEEKERKRKKRRKRREKKNKKEKQTKSEDKKKKKKKEETGPSEPSTPNSSRKAEEKPVPAVTTSKPAPWSNSASNSPSIARPPKPVIARITKDSDSPQISRMHTPEEPSLSAPSSSASSASSLSDSSELAQAITAPESVEDTSSSAPVDHVTETSSSNTGLLNEEETKSAGTPTSQPATSWLSPRGERRNNNAPSLGSHSSSSSSLLSNARIQAATPASGNAPGSWSPAQKKANPPKPGPGAAPVSSLSVSAGLSASSEKLKVSASMSSAAVEKDLSPSQTEDSPILLRDKPVSQHSAKKHLSSVISSTTSAAVKAMVSTSSSPSHNANDDEKEQIRKAKWAEMEKKWQEEDQLKNQEALEAQMELEKEMELKKKLKEEAKKKKKEMKKNKEHPTSPSTKPVVIGEAVWTKTDGFEKVFGTKSGDTPPL